MNILAFDTCFGACSVALVRRDGAGVNTIATEQRHMTRGHAETLIPMVERVLQTADVTLAKVDRFAVTSGPGTFAGVRVGIATARALSLATGKPVVGVGTLEALAQTALDEHTTLESPFAVVRDARREQVYVQSFRIERHHVVPTMDAPVVCPPANVPALLPASPDNIAAAIGSGARLVPWPAGHNPHCNDTEVEVSAVAVGQLAAFREPSSAPVSPLYLRQPDAKPQTGFALERQSTPT